MCRCASKTKAQDDNWQGIVITGKVVYMDLEGGFFGIKGDDGNNYNPLNLGPEYHKDGLRVKASISIEKNINTIRMWGKTVRINRIIRLE
jgi:hypothetical protein